MTRLSELGESHIISRVLGRNPSSTHVIVGPGDDAAVTAPEGRLVSTADMLVENEDFTREWLDWQKLGVKAAAQNLADVCAMGAVPHGLLVSLAIPDDTDIADLEALYSGLFDEAERTGAALECTVPIIGGDLSSSKLIVIAITALGTVPEGSAILRSGAQPGDSLYLAGTVGRAAAGLDLLFAGLRRETAGPELRPLIETQLAPRPDYGALRVIGASAMIDVSDGLSLDLARVATASGVGIELDRALLADLIDPLLPAAEFVLDARSANGTAATAEDLALSWVLDGGEDHGFAASAPSRQSPGVGWRRIGRVRTGHDVSLDGTPVPASGFSHFGK
ncbi:thiamine-phosphate kinase [Brevibacterium iodinum ATCC 49514]|uniref:Thiamine-monophosphate kinase n=1 Tax=Brevibacterium iodinum ATCC 49514 TaxID=1255616 RepID=A0A2H1IDN5_9MICO|nr:thiamine-phosphate kinase [Brevibacterium iodinum]SMX73293.1 thiamine-phosphate kinase [Brevibacterium iodinum ATCC 49514]SUW13080.1 Thiamine-monophosphate kinase [Brevibacterium iodinum]